jgi:hypothetical protein
MMANLQIPTRRAEGRLAFLPRDAFRCAGRRQGSAFPRSAVRSTAQACEPARCRPGWQSSPVRNDPPTGRAITANSSPRRANPQLRCRLVARTTCEAECRDGQLRVSTEHAVDIVRVESKDPAAPVDRRNSVGNPASNSLHAHAHPGSSGGQRLVGARGHLILPFLGPDE